VADIFVSYTSSDRDWAFWIGQELEKLGHHPRIHEWEISGGGDIPRWMEERHHDADHILCVISRAYLSAPYSSWERRAAQWAAATDRPNFALPAFVEPCEPPTMLAQIKRCDLYDIDEDEARERLKAFVAPATKPLGLMRFPGTKRGYASASPSTMVAFPGRSSGDVGAALSNVPIAVPLHFLGRDDDIAAIDAVFAGGKTGAAITTLHGMRGVGKTTLAAAYAERRRSDHRATWWIRAQTESTMRADLVGLGVQFGWVRADEKEEPAIATVMERLREEGEGILLIYDNASDAAALRKNRPRSGGARVLVTSNSPVWRGVAEPIEIEVWPHEVGAEYLVERTGREAERVAAKALSEALAGLPLAHEQAAAYCERLGIPLAEYHKRFEAAPVHFLDDTRAAPREYNDGMTVAKSFAIAIEEAAKLHPAAAPLIVYAALLPPEPIPLFLFSEAREEFDQPLATALANDGLDEAVATLRGFSLVDRESIADERNSTITTDCIRLHRLVRQMATVRCEGKERDAALQKLIDAVAQVYPDGVVDDPKVWPRARRLDLPALMLVGGDAAVPPGSERASAYVLDRLASYRQFALGDYAQARPLFERALAFREEVDGPDSRDTASSLSNLALLLKEQGDLQRAQPLCERALAICEKVCGPEHPDTAITLNNLASLLRELPDLATARSLLERALAICEKGEGPEHPSTARALNNLGMLMAGQGEFAEARQLLERALGIRGKVLGAEHPHTNMTRANLVQLMLRSGEATGALPLAQAALAAHNKVLGKDHPWTKRTARAAADVLVALARADEAAALRAQYGIVAEGATKGEPNYG
jgi:tetratricopeptide (TPR) repeat protein